jgi:hypothetical protein
LDRVSTVDRSEDTMRQPRGAFLIIEQVARVTAAVVSDFRDSFLNDCMTIFWSESYARTQCPRPDGSPMGNPK